MAPQIADALRHLTEAHGISAVAKACGVTPNTVTRCLSGVGLKVSTLEAVAQMASWTVEIKDRDGLVIARHP